MKKKIVLIVVIIMSLLAVTMIYQTYATSSSISNDSNAYNITLIGSTEELVVPALNSKTVVYQISNTNKGVVQYGVAYSGDNIIVKVYNTSSDPAVGNVDYGGNKFVKLFIENKGTEDSVVTLKTILGYENGGSLEDIVPSGYSLVKEMYYDYAMCSNAAECITNLYLNNKDNIVKNNNIKYNYATSVNLMNDRLGGITEDFDAGNIRYYGATPNNYVDIGDRDRLGNVILYRIIGVFKDMIVVNDDGTTELQDLIKVIRADSIGTYAWDNKTNGVGSSLSDNGSCNWKDARLMMLLNPGYEAYNTSNPLLDDDGDIIYGYKGSLWWNSENGTCYAGNETWKKSCDFRSTGLSKNVQNKIVTVVWNLASNTSVNIYANVMYSAERGTTTYPGYSAEWTGKVALMYTSDYAYATDFNQCNAKINGYNTEECTTNDWLYITDKHQWTLTSFSTSSNSVRPVHSEGRITTFNAFNAIAVRPSFYLNSELNIESGIGTMENPYIIG